MSIAIGNIELSSPVILAPMSGVTDLPFRQLVKKFGAGLVVSEMVASRAMIAETKQSLKKCAIMLDDATGACVQLAGCDPDVIALSAKMNEDMGAKIIDLNFGCPAKKVVGGYAGSALMQDEVLAKKILETTVKAVNIPVTVKMRMGWDHSNHNAPVLAKIAEDVGIQMVTVHGRTRCQFYTGRANWDFIKTVKNAVKIPVIANGDIISIEAAKECLDKSGADGIMIGRGAYGKPWFISQVEHFLKRGIELPQPSHHCKLQIILEHYDSMLSYYGIDIGVKLARKHLGWYAKGLANASHFRQTINMLSDYKAVRESIINLWNA